MSTDSIGHFLQQARVQGRVIWALTMREVITRFGREGLGSIWMFVEPSMFVVGVMAIYSHIDINPSFSMAEYLAVSYPTLLLWRNGTNRVTKSLEINRALLHHTPIRPIDIFYSRILLEFSAAALTFFILYLFFIQLGICHPPYDTLTMALGYALVVWFSFAFVLFMSALAELSEAIERVSHIILYLMLPFSGVFLPAATVPPDLRQYLLAFPLVDCVEFFHHGYYGARMPTYYYLPQTIFELIFLTLVSLTLTQIAIKRALLNTGG